MLLRLAPFPYTESTHLSKPCANNSQFSDTITVHPSGWKAISRPSEIVSIFNSVPYAEHFVYNLVLPPLSSVKAGL